MHVWHITTLLKGYIEWIPYKLLRKKYKQIAHIYKMCVLTWLQMMLLIKLNSIVFIELATTAYFDRVHHGAAHAHNAVYFYYNFDSFRQKNYIRKKPLTNISLLIFNNKFCTIIIIIIIIFDLMAYTLRSGDASPEATICT